MSVQVRLRAGIMIAASAVIVSGLGYGVAVGSGPVGGLRLEPAAVTAPPTAAGLVAAAVTTRATTGVAKVTTATKKPTTSTRATTPTKATVARPVAVVPVSTKLTMTAVSTTVKKEQYYRAVLRGTLINAKSKTPVSDQKVTLYRRLPGSTAWTALVWDKSDARTGKVLLAVEQTAAKAEYKLVYAGRSPYLAATSPIITIKRG